MLRWYFAHFNSGTPRRITGSEIGGEMSFTDVIAAPNLPGQSDLGFGADFIRAVAKKP